MSLQPWKCPECSTWIAPGVAEHRCDEPPAAAAPVDPHPPTPVPPTYVPTIVPVAQPGQWFYGGPIRYYGDVVLPGQTFPHYPSGARTISNTVSVSITGPVSAEAVAHELTRMAGASFHSAG